MPVDTPTPIKRALISVSDKTGLADFGRFLAGQGVEILSTGGSAKALAEAGVAVVEVAAHTGFPEIMGGRVKTLHPKIHGGILARRDDEGHLAAMQEHAIAGIDMVVSNLYPFEATLASGADYDTCVENIDIGGPAMVRASAKNHDFVTIITDPADYGAVEAEMSANGGAVSATLRRRLAKTAFSHTAAYDAMIAGWLAKEQGETFPDRLTLAGRKTQELRYGENPHQQAAAYAAGPARPGVVSATQLQGKELSYNNLNDTNAAFELVAEFEAPTVAIIKHANPCGVASRDSLSAAYAEALACDPVSAFGGIIAVNRSLDAATAEEVAKLFAEVVIAPEVDEAAKAVLASKKNLRVLVTGALPDPSEPGMVTMPLAGGFLAQSRDNGRLDPAALKVVTKRQPSERELTDMIFAFRVAKHVKSNAIVYVRDGATVGVGAGQMSRVDSSRIAAWKAREAAPEGQTPKTEGSVVASDAFFPFADGLLAAVEAGATAVIQPGGSMRDEEVIAAADEAGLAMVFTGMRHFRH
ncbi:bifunctional phosphoribosylaminoimidazolecarboxamide formyltransferase/IMP cyclohydrolase [Pelagibius marinus]|uniref:bifunctional phosphoribosylaminoimidazolecarboxamide formyltransferase/IMP cyclohydrolase n=1 Tax=Pelagibius marinus TaxID=2762760 RepID=UPI0018726D97|nr:bifunctional phosphoribosylaminoimidazolecarboxamide formyltransferase/IMP cyclohydrolase [Pelagibius marinus]